MYNLGRSLQFVGLFVLPLAILMELQAILTLGQSLLMSAFGGLLFLLGYYLQGVKP